MNQLPSTPGKNKEQVVFEGDLGSGRGLAKEQAGFIKGKNQGHFDLQK